MNTKILVVAAVLLSFTATGLISCGGGGDEARIFHIKGDVKVQKAGETEWKKATVDMTLKSGDKIKTGAGSETELALDKKAKTVMRLDKRTEVKLSNVKDKKTEMPKGKILGLAKDLPKGSSFEVRTPTSVAGIRGSGIGVRTDGKRTQVACYEDKAYVRGIKKDGTLTPETKLEAGTKSTVKKHKAPTTPRAMTANEMRTWQTFNKDIFEHMKEFSKEFPGSADFVKAITSGSPEKLLEISQKILANPGKLIDQPQNLVNDPQKMMRQPQRIPQRSVPQAPSAPQAPQNIPSAPSAPSAPSGFGF